MNIKQTLKALMVGLILIVPATHANTAIPRDFDSYINAALVVYANRMSPSIETSEKFYNYLEARWHFLQCRSTPECERLGSSVAYEFADLRVRS